jgi:hypothetical protein
MTKKKRKRHTPKQIVKKLRGASAMLNAAKELEAASSTPGKRSDPPLAEAIRWDESQ